MKRNLVILLIVFASILSGCAFIDQREAVKKTNDAITAKNYEEAEKWAEEAVLAGYDNKKFLKLKTNIEIYNDAEEALNSLNYELAEKKMDKEELFKGNKMSSALSDMFRKILDVRSVVTMYEKDEPSSYATSIKYIDELFEDFDLTEQQIKKLTEYKESAQQKCVKRAIEKGEPSNAIRYVDEFLANTDLSENQKSILDNLKFDAQVADIEKNINDKFFSSSAKKKLQELLDSNDLTYTQRNRLMKISQTGTSTVQETPTTRRSPKAYISEESAIEKAKQAEPDAFSDGSDVTVSFNNGCYIVNVHTLIDAGSEVIEEEKAFTVDALTGDVVGMAG